MIKKKKLYLKLYELQPTKLKMQQFHIKRFLTSINILNLYRYLFSQKL